jgi:predicted P-loop ATPase
MSWVTFPLFPVNSDGSCGCMNPQCENPGKHPCVKWGRKSLGPGQSVPVPQGFGIGVATGSRSDIIGVDLDCKDGNNGLEALFILGDVPETLSVLTPSGGYHLYYKNPDFTVKNSASVIGPGVDIRGEGGYLVMPPSRHKNGGFYKWVDPNVPIIKAPAWLLDLIKNPKQIFQVRRETLEKLAKQWRRSQSVIRQEFGESLMKVCKGEAFAEPGQRDNMLWNLSVELAKSIPGADVDKLTEFFAQSVQLMDEEAPDAPTLDDVHDKLTRAFQEHAKVVAGWTAKMDTSDKGKPIGSIGNVTIIIENHEAFKDLLAYDERRGKAILLRVPPWSENDDSAPRDLEDHDGTAFARWLTEHQRLNAGADVCLRAMALVSRNKSFDSFREHLEALPAWDGIPRLDRWLIDYAGATDIHGDFDSRYIRSVSAKFVISLIARTLPCPEHWAPGDSGPGCKVDTLLILEGPQGFMKSSLLKALVGRKFFADDLPDLESKDARDYLRGPALIEISELGAFDRKTVNRIKSFLVQCYDRFRAAYEKMTVDYTRRNVFAGTTNDDQYLRDWTGNRRYWPVRVTKKCAIKEFLAHRDQILAEAIYRYKQGEKWWLDDHEEVIAQVEQSARREDDSWVEKIINGLKDGVKRRGPLGLVGGPTKSEWAIQPSPESVSVAEILEYVLTIPASAVNRSHEMRIANIMRDLGWIRKRLNSDGNRSWRYFRPVFLNPQVNIQK